MIYFLKKINKCWTRLPSEFHCSITNCSLKGCKRIHNKEKSVVSFMHKQNIICSRTQFDDIAYEQTIFCRQLFADNMVGSRPMKRKKNCIKWYGCLPMKCLGTSRHSFGNVNVSQIKLEFGSAGFWAEQKTGVPGEKPLEARTKTNNKLYPHVINAKTWTRAIHWWEATVHP